MNLTSEPSEPGCESDRLVPVAAVSLPMLFARSALAGMLMGLANIVPGISGGTMLLAMGVYPRFIGAIAEITTLQFRRDSLVVLATIAAAALAAIVVLSRLLSDLVVDHRWVMYSLFIGLTLGGLPVIWGMLRQVTPAVWIGAAAGFVLMAALALVQAMGTGAGGEAQRGELVLMFLAGVVAASAMILPGISGAYLFLVMGVYVPVLAGVSAMKEAVFALDVQAMMAPATTIVLPVGLGVLVGVVAVSNLVKWLLARFEQATLGVLVGLLLGAVVGLWPFQRGVAPQEGDVIRGQTMTAETIAALKPKDYPTELFTPSAGVVLAAVALLAAGFIITQLIARLGGRGGSARTAQHEA